MRLKPPCFYLIPLSINDLHSTKVRLKLIGYDETTGAITDLHSTKVRLKQFQDRIHVVEQKTFTFH